ncbi:MAG: ribonuclease HIII [Spirochaetes bacterium GWB1_36_13]|nr:MAG: ribonuclease HIII [Spirochaetes bacterium GWB1_36_13]
MNKEKEEKFLSFTKESHIGTDESGKGDYLGAIVIAGVYVDKETNEKLKSLGVKDSKTISDSKIKEMAPEIRRLVGEDKYSVIKINPEKYNELYDKMKNMNELLAWGHARAIENLLIKNDCTAAIADQFGNEEYINKALMENGKKIELLQIHKAERDIAVAAASILAREGFLTSIEAMGIKYGITIPKGANETVIKVTKSIIEKNGEGELTKIAKLNFKTTQQVIKN